MRGYIYQQKRQAKGGWTIVLDLPRDPITGKRRQQSITVKGTKKDAERRLRELLHQLDTGGFVEPINLTLAEYLEQWLRDYAAINTAPRTYERYVELVRHHLTPGLGSIPLVSLKPNHIQAYYSNALQTGRRDGKGGLSARTVHHIHRLLFEALKYAFRYNMIVRNPAEAVDPPRPEFKEMTSTDADGVNRLLQAVKDSYYHPLLFTAIYTGLRRSEVLALRWQNVDLDMATMSVTDTLHHMKDGRLIIRQPKSKHSRRSIALSPALAILLRGHKAKQVEVKNALGLELQDSDLVFCHPDGSPLRPNSISHGFRKIAARVGLPALRFHDLRHTHATLLLKQGVHPKIVSERLGHSSIAITLDTYSHVLPGLQEDAAKRFDQSLQQVEVERQIEQIIKQRTANGA